MQLSQKLIEKGIINEKASLDIDTEINKTGKTEEEIILERKIVPEEFLFKLKSEILKIPLKKVTTEEIPLTVLELIPEDPAMTYKMVSLNKKKAIIEIGMVYPENTAAQDALRFLSRQGKFRYKIFLISITDFNNILKQYRTLTIETERALAGLEEKKEAADLEEELIKGVASEEAPIIKMVLVILKHAVEGLASDIHVEPEKDRLKVRFRLDGILYPSLFLPLRVHSSIVTRIKILSNLKIDETRIPQDGRFSARIAGKNIDFRVSTFPTLFGEKVALRVLDPTEGLKPYEELGLKGRNFEIIKEAIRAPYGLILSTGPTGSGKTTTLYALLRILNNEGVNIITIEDPIEYAIPGVNQSQTKAELGYTFARGLRQILRQDPDIIMVGEVRDEETASLVIHSALTGHIVLSTLHTNSAVGVIPRLIDMGVRSFLIPATLKVAISQRLVRVLCPHCKKKIKPTEEVKKYILKEIATLPLSVKKSIKVPETIYIFEAKGCEKCNFRGYIGRTGLFEVLSMTDKLADLILENPMESLIFKLAQQQGMLTMEQEGVLKILDGETTVEEVSRVTEEK